MCLNLCAETDRRIEQGPCRHLAACPATCCQVLVKLLMQAARKTLRILMVWSLGSVGRQRLECTKLEAS